MLIAALRGHITSVFSDSCLIDVQGVGYQVFMPLPALEELRRQTGEITIQTHLYVREDTLALYGFLHPDDKALFVQIIGVSGIGPKTALALLSVLPADRLREAVRREDARALASVPGIGLKTAQRLVLELKGKMGKGVDAAALARESGAGAGGAFSDAVDALMALGYAASDAVRAAEEVVRENPGRPSGEIVREALKRLSRK